MVCRGRPSALEFDYATADSPNGLPSAPHAGGDSLQSKGVPLRASALSAPESGLAERLQG
jgi:hypothetical protein